MTKALSNDLRERVIREVASPVSALRFPGVREAPTFRWVRLARRSLWAPIRRRRAREGRFSGPSLCSSFFNFRFGATETGSIGNRDWFAGPRIGC